MKPHELALLAIVALAVLWQAFPVAKDLYCRHRAIRARKREREKRILARLNYSLANYELQKHQWR